ncbi:MAG: TetR/AcrR family transcriptional regulator [Candidatus Rifleibacteriota bacterium]
MARKATGARKEQIIETTRDLIFTRGFSNFTVRTVAGLVGISEAAVYRHFASKEDLLQALLDSLFVPWRQSFNQIASEKSSVAERLVALAARHIEFLLEKKLNPMLFFSEAISPENPGLLKVLQTNLLFFNQLLQSLFKEGAAKKEFAVDLDVESAAVCFLGIVQASIIRWTVFQSDHLLKEDTIAKVSFFLKQIVKVSVK